MEFNTNAGIESHKKVSSYKNFNVAVYMPVGNVLRATSDMEQFDRDFAPLYENVRIGRVYVENYRSQQFATTEQLRIVKEYFESKGIVCSGGITTCDDDRRRGFASLCYSNPSHRDIVKKSIGELASVFDEIIFDDFYFLNCRCSECIKAKGDRTWSQFRLDQKREVTKTLVMDVAKAVNPDCNVIVKFPQWYEVYNETGYDLQIDPDLFDCIYTGTETRNPTYSQQHLPKYLSYFIMRYLESAAPERNLGGWFDPYDCTYNLTSYLEQAYLTLFGKAKEATLFCLGSLIYEAPFKLFPMAVGAAFEEMDAYLDKLGNPVGVAAYRPVYARGEDNLHNYIGMCGFPLEPSIHYDETAGTMFLAEGAAYDPDIADKMKESLRRGADVIVTSGFVRKMGEAFTEFANITYSSRKAIVSEYSVTNDHGITISGRYSSDAAILIPQLDYCTNDVWELAAGYGTDNNFPIVLRFCYDKGRICVVTIPDNMGEMYHYPEKVWNVIRGLAENSMKISMSGPAGVQLFVYDNDTCIVRSDLPYTEKVTLSVPSKFTKAVDLTSGMEFPIKDGQIVLNAMSNFNYVIKMK